MTARTLGRWALICGALLNTCVFAHEDPQGDVHPSVSIENGSFAVWFSNNVSGAPVYFKNVITPDGISVSTRDSVEEPELSIPDWAARVGSLYPFGSKEYGGLKLPLQWKEKTTDTGGFTEHKGQLIFHLSGLQAKTYPFYFAAYDLAAKKLVSRAAIGVPGRIYSFPSASRVLVIGDDAYLAWINEWSRVLEKAKLDDGTFTDVYTTQTQLVLSKWRIGTREVLHFPICETMGDNVHIGVNHIGNRLLVAWHEGVGLKRSQIWTEIVDVGSTDFQNTLSLSAKPSKGMAEWQRFINAHEDAELRRLLSLLSEADMGDDYDAVKKLVPELGALHEDAGEHNTEAVMNTGVGEIVLRGEVNFASGHLVSYGFSTQELSHRLAHKFLTRCVGILEQVHGPSERRIELPNETDGPEGSLGMNFFWRKNGTRFGLDFHYRPDSATVSWGAQAE